MPELPEVETVKTELAASGIVNCPIVDVEVFWSKTVFPHTPESFRSNLIGQSIRAMYRRAKLIHWEFSASLHLLIHLRMTGQFLFLEKDQKRDKHHHILIHFANQKTLAYKDPRKFGRLTLIKNPASVFASYGPEPLEPEFTAFVLQAILKDRKSRIKPLLLDQSLIAGLGNIYADEALFEARIHPETQGLLLGYDEIARLHLAIQKVLKTGLSNLGTTLGTGAANFYSVNGRAGRNRDQLQVFRRTGLPCLHCQTPIKRIVLQQRSTHFCPSCQPCLIS